MVETNASLQQNLTLLDPMSLLLSQNSDPQNSPVSLKLVTENYFMERGPRYNEYAELRESRLRRRIIREEEEEINHGYEPKQSPLKKQVRFQGILTGSRKGSSVSSVLAQSVPDFSATLRKENRKPASGPLELTPPSKNWSKMNGNMSNSRGSKSANAGEKKGMIARKSYANIEELKGMSMGVANDICRENRGGRSMRTGIGKNVLSRQYSMLG